MIDLKLSSGGIGPVTIDLAMVSVMYQTKAREVCLYIAGRERPLMVQANFKILRKQVEHAKATLPKPK